MTAQLSRPALSGLHADVLGLVADGLVVCHPAVSHHVPGWGWAGGGDMFPGMQDALTVLLGLRLVGVDRSGRFHVDGDPVTVTEAGRIALGGFDVGRQQA